MKRFVLVLLIIIISTLLFWTTYLYWPALRDLLLPTFQNSYYIAPPMEGILLKHVLFSAMMGLMPAAIYALWIYAPVISNKKRVISVIIILLSLIVTTIAYRLYLQVNLSSLENIGVEAGIPFSSIHFESYILLGFILGGLITFFTLKQKQAKYV